MEHHPVQLTQPVIAQTFDQSVLEDIGSGWSSFVESGQVWALIIGIVIGYFLRSLTK